MPFNVDSYGDSGGLMTGNGIGTLPAPIGPGGKTMMAPDTSQFTGMSGVDYSMAPIQTPSVPAIPGNPTGINNVPGGLTRGSNISPITSPPNTAQHSDSANPIMNLNPIIAPPGLPTGPIGTATSFAQPGTSTATAQAGTGLAKATGGNSTVSNIIQGLNGVGGNPAAPDPAQLASTLNKILNIPNTTSVPNAPGLPNVTGAPVTSPVPAPINTPFPANGIDTTGATAPANVDLGGLLGIKQNTNLPSQLDDIYGKGFGNVYANLLQKGGGFNPDINNALINAMRPQESRAFDNIRQTMANAGLSPSGSPFALAAGDFWSQASNNENSVIAQNFNQALDRTYNLFGQGLEAAQVSEANKMGPLQWLSALSPLLGPLISGLASKIPNISINSTTSAQGGQGTAQGQGGTSTSTGTGGTTTSTSTSQGGAGGAGGTATSQSNPTVSPTISPTISQSPQIDPTMNPTFSNVPSFNVSPTFTNSPHIDPSITPTFQNVPSFNVSPTFSPTISPSINPSILGTVSPTFQNTPTFQNNPSVHVNPTLTNTSSNDAHIAPIISPSISPTMINSMGGGGLPSGFPGQPSPIGPPPGVGSIPISNFPFPPTPTPPGPHVGTTIGFPGGPQGPSGVGNAPPAPPGGYGNMPVDWNPYSPVNPNFGPGMSNGFPYDPGPPSVSPFPYPAGGWPGGGNPGLIGTPSTNPALDPNAWGSPYIPLGPDPYQPAPIQSGMDPNSGGNFNTAAYSDSPYNGDPFSPSFWSDPYLGGGGSGSGVDYSGTSGGGGNSGWGWDMASLEDV